MNRMTAAGPTQGGHSPPSGGSEVVGGSAALRIRRPPCGDSEAWGPSSAAGPLAGIGVLVTRPPEQASRLMAQLQTLGAQPVAFPALAIAGASRPEALRLRLAAIDQYDWLLFISPTAVQFGLAALNLAQPLAVESLAQRRTAAVGGATAAALRAAGCRQVVVPASGADSEQLLALPEFADLAGRRILIFRGEGGRELIADTLRARGGEVDYAECYRRVRPQTDPAPLQKALNEQRLHAVTVFSRETLDYLLELLNAAEDARNGVLALPLFVPHERIAAHARALGFTRVIVTAAGESGVLAGLVEYFRHD